MVHQLNLVLKGEKPSRLNVALWLDVLRARQAGKDVAEFLGVPLLDQASEAVEGPNPDIVGVDGRRQKGSGVELRPNQPEPNGKKGTF
jgi:hypothetical protein